METTLVLLEKSFIQLGAHHLYTRRIFDIWFAILGTRKENQNLFDIFGSMYAAVLFLGIINCMLIIPYVAIERTVSYRERFAGTYPFWAYSLAQEAIEIPFSLIRAVAFVLLTYPMIGYSVSAYKVFWCFYAIFSSFLYYNYLGMLLVALTRNYVVAQTLSSTFYAFFNLFSGYLIPQPQIPKWWIWLYYLFPTSWTLNGLLTSQYGDIEKDITVFGEIKNSYCFLKR
ncbi:pleiotropic drug resistance protein 3-like [Tripterygium wilfordii]|uniref:pleiotropic drug resistance protein 3-like n=1 Tax=Tripterygium wilfordii TaxID=458696 RepID=UPI0018F85385|nr:pleiotropic drug resistance protein 3-like [Tripterygium wilfordii]